MRFSVRDLIDLSGVLALLLAILVPMVNRNRDRVRVSTCRSHLKFIGLALHNYHFVFRQLPSAMDETETNRHRVSGLVALAHGTT